MKPLPSSDADQFLVTRYADAQWSDWVRGKATAERAQHREIARRFLRATPTVRRHMWHGGSRPPLPEAVKDQARELCARGTTQTDAARQLGISQSAVSRIVRGLT